MYRYGVLLLALISLSTYASEPIPTGKIKNLTYRAGWVMFKIVNASGVNACETCPTDPGAMGSKRCWIKGDESAQLSMILSAQARDKSISGRVTDLSSSCGLYQMSVSD